jgi:hypothetical protein
MSISFIDSVIKINYSSIDLMNLEDIAWLGLKNTY